MNDATPGRAPLAAALTLTLLAAAATALAQDPSPAAGADDARTLFLANCAPCHGENGDGQGTTELDRPARSFRAGGFSYGNTPDAIFRTVTYGIPGTPMPAFESAFPPAQREALAAYVISLGPGLPPPPENSELVVGERAVVVRGMLPPLTDLAVPVPRGLAIGLPSGMCFEYRTDDVRLLGVRQGRFVDRTDWVGRGGTPLAPLGQVVYTLAGGAPDACWSSGAEAAAPLRAVFRGTWIRGARAGLRYELRGAEDAPLARVEEECASVASSLASGYRRSFAVRDAAQAAPLLLRALDPSGGAWESAGATGYRVRPDGRLELYLVAGSAGFRLERPEAPAHEVALDGAGVGELRVTVLVSHELAPASPEERQAFLRRVLEEVQP
ncbi:MAG: c-type cytochrome [Planctomycetes bacterium]|nr:c-type cytochrome [Planctomycetota bacterium]